MASTPRFFVIAVFTAGLHPSPHFCLANVPSLFVYLHLSFELLLAGQCTTTEHKCCTMGHLMITFLTLCDSVELRACAPTKPCTNDDSIGCTDDYSRYGRCRRCDLSMFCAKGSLSILAPQSSLAEPCARFHVVANTLCCAMWCPDTGSAAPRQARQTSKGMTGGRSQKQQAVCLHFGLKVTPFIAFMEAVLTLLAHVVAGTGPAPNFCVQVRITIDLCGCYTISGANIECCSTSRWKEGRTT